MFHVPEKYRIAGKKSYGNNGQFEFKFQGKNIFTQASDGAGWEHVSVSINRKKVPNWAIMCYVKNLFWDKEDTVIQYHPAESDYVNYHAYVLHLWRPIDQDFPKPPPILVGIK